MLAIIANYAYYVNMKRIPINTAYGITTSGQVFSYKRGRFMKQSSHNLGYRLVILKGRLWYVHRLMAITFLNASEVFEVNHIDKDKSNNCLDNLELVTHSQNLHHHYNTLDAQDRFNLYIDEGMDLDVALYAIG